jgi:transcriptional regulator with XRE-family HTH domain
MTAATNTFGLLLRTWRTRRRLSQQDLAAEAGVSTRHLSCLETQRSFPSRTMVLRLGERLNLPLREQNQLVLAAGYAPVFTHRPFDHPALASAAAAVQQVLRGHGPCPALAVDRHWNLLAANAALHRLTQGTDAALLEPPVNALRLSLHPQGLAPRIENYGEWRAHLLSRLRRETELSADPALSELLAELSAYPAPPGSRAFTPDTPPAPALVVPLHLRVPGGTLALISTTTVFGTPLDVTLAELAIEVFFPMDERSEALLSTLASASASQA